MNYYEILGVNPQCDFATMKKAYYKRAKECHPDRFANAPGKVEEFKQLALVSTIVANINGALRIFTANTQKAVEYTAAAFYKDAGMLK